MYRIVAKAGDVSDGEEAAIPVLTNRMLVTETMPLPMRGDGTKDFKLEKLSTQERVKRLPIMGLQSNILLTPPGMQCRHCLT